MNRPSHPPRSMWRRRGIDTDEATRPLPGDELVQGPG